MERDCYAICIDETKGINKGYPGKVVGFVLKGTSKIPCIKVQYEDGTCYYIPLDDYSYWKFVTLNDLKPAGK